MDIGCVYNSLMTWIAHYGTKDLRLIVVFTRQQYKKANKMSKEDGVIIFDDCSDFRFVLHPLPLIHPWAATGEAVFGECPLPDLHVTGAEGPGTGEQIIPPLAVESLAQIIGEIRPRGFEVFVPLEERLVIVRTEVMQIFGDE